MIAMQVFESGLNISISLMYMSVRNKVRDTIQNNKYKTINIKQ
ncbi:hypothetical protein PCIT_a0171 [Pseudoalteromonas citrea]|uniref:Uncharacterized protein n=1 Tax=Pseudoalteromonas citrea TaxID=43655 RepID=A0AAD4AK64_9GAMM|nr:hypothetical protein PCIT_a0171 [Pseudoalteromonas citrea]